MEKSTSEDFKKSRMIFNACFNACTANDSSMHISLKKKYVKTCLWIKYIQNFLHL